MNAMNIMLSPVADSLSLVLFKSKERIEDRGVQTYEGILTFSELASHFQVEPNAADGILAEEFKRQRDVDATRVSGLKRYWDTSEGPVFPSMTIFASDLTVVQTTDLGGRKVVQAVLPWNADRFICDGQGRTTFIKDLLKRFDDCGDYTIGFKLVVTNTADLQDENATAVIKQTFSDYHVRLLKPKKSLSKHFDSSNPLARLTNALLDVPAGDVLYRKRIALHGKIRRGHVWTFDQFSTLVTRFLGVSGAAANKQLADQDVYEASFSMLSAYLTKLSALLPMESLDVDHFQSVHESSMFTKAIFCSAIGYVGKSIVDDMVNNPAITFDSALGALSMPIASKDDKYWTTNRITMVDDGAVHIIKGTDRRIGSLICRELRIYPCAELSA